MQKERESDRHAQSENERKKREREQEIKRAIDRGRAVKRDRRDR